LRQDVGRHDTYYYGAAGASRAFGQYSSAPGVSISGDAARETVTIWREWSRLLGARQSLDLGLGGWSLSEHHFYDTTAGALLKGNGGRRLALK